MQFAGVHAFVAWGPANLATSPTDPKFLGIKNLRVTDVIIRGNHTSTEVQPVGHGSAVVKILGSKDALIENVESYENYGPGFWFDASNFGYVVRGNYFHDNLYRGAGYSPGRGLHLEIGWHGLVEWNVFANNAHEGLAISNSSGVTVRNNLFVGNRRQIVLSNWDRGASFLMKDIRIEQNQFRDWVEHGAIDVLGNINPENTPSLNITVDYNMYQPISSDVLSGWWGYFVKSLGDARTKLGWEEHGSIGAIAWPP
jgi:parallel beta-helix repeat protein